MLPISAKDVVRFTPRVELLAWLQARLDEATDVEQHEALERQIGKVQDEIDAAPQPVYLLAVASHLQRAAFRRDLLATGATYAGDAALYAALREDLEAVAPVNLPELLAIVDEVEAAGKPADAAPEVRDRWPGITRVARALGGRFAALEGDQEFYLSVAPIVACRHFLLGWENVDAPFTRRGNLTTDETLAALEEGEMQAIGFKAMNLMRPTKALEKNSASPSRSASSPRPSRTATSKRLTAQRGSSTENASSETPASA
ncbi:hypothetical protein FZ983_16965 [Azospirillum sp. B21]|uniref:hypothetical protein n=1 Tax=Azospirillum sp. B21 TaxID=2607496 RepID=UPI0011EC8193|nr:hypothetical protein [Azospirillum sp. B21]KAA0579015.1 hypothetical protein FZ983_16965 [Azospirillum sp. B21]